ncbi:MAG: hypothetical protein RSF42_17310 [Comamonas sp.]
MATPVPPIDPQLPPFPGPNTPESAYDDMAFAWGAAMPGHGNRVAAIGQNVYENAEEARQSADDAADSAQDAADQLVLVQTAASGAFASANYKGDWVSLSGALAVPATVTHLGRLWYLKSNLANVASQTPALGSTYWGEVSRNDFTVLACPAGTTVAADRGLYRMNSPSSILQLPPNPFHGMVAAAVNVSGTLTPVIQRNGKTICGDAEDYLMNVLGWQIMLQFDSASNDWVRISGVTAYTAAQPAIASANTWTALQNFTGGLNMNGNPVVANGSNANGSWTRWADGTQICTRVAADSVSLASQGTQTLADWTFPVPFSSLLYADFKLRNNDAVNVHSNIYTVGLTSGTPQLRNLTTSSISGASVQTMMVAIGRWF